jgi:hypothetical protein
VQLQRMARGVLPQGHPRRPDTMLQNAIAGVEVNGLAAQADFVRALDTLCSDEKPAFYEAISDSVLALVPCGHLVEISIAAFAVDLSWDVLHGQHEGEEAGGASHVQVVELTCEWLEGHMASAPEDSLLDQAEV